MLTLRALLLARPSEPMALVFDMCGHKNSCTSAAVLYRDLIFDAAKVQTFLKTASFFLQTCCNRLTGSNKKFAHLIGKASKRGCKKMGFDKKNLLD